MPKQTEYKVGIYLRISCDDERQGESLSIENQRRVLTNYVKEQGWTIYDEYVDDGISGVTFDEHPNGHMVNTQSLIRSITFFMIKFYKPVPIHYPQIRIRMMINPCYCRSLSSI